uniref:Uncharacterized protein n=1 Tax=Myoviridae sp. ctbEa13 TaxID=2825136 RepID=A0A8S5VBT9_9CAUD|nr:MAG TPA: hypothetical protein [Myoviridae sp. ctbEa13]
MTSSLFRVRDCYCDICVRVRKLSNISLIRNELLNCNVYAQVLSPHFRAAIICCKISCPDL